jgi:hypothetical protein
VRRLGRALRARLTPGRVLLAAVLVGAFLAIVAIAQDEGGGAPPDNAARLVPADALAYAHATLDRDSSQWKDGTRVLERFPRIVAERDRLLRGLTRHRQGIDLDREVYPWLGDEAAIALLQGADRKAHSLILLEVSDQSLARSFLSRVVTEPRLVPYHGTAVRIYGRLATAFLGRFLAIGTLENVQAAIDVRSGRDAALARSLVFERALHGLPDRDRLLVAFATPAGIETVLAARGGIVARLARLVAEPGLDGAAAALRVDGDHVRIDYAGALRSAARQGTASFAPSLLNAVPRDVAAYVGMRGAARILRGIARLAGSTAVELPPSLRRVRSELAGAGRAGALRGLEPLLRGEAALLVSSGNPALLTLVVGGIGRRESDQLLARLQPVLSRLLREPVEGQVPTFQPLTIAGVSAATLTIAPGLSLTYSIFGGRAVVSTSTDGIRAVRSRGPKIGANPLYDGDLPKAFDGVTSVVFLDLERLLALGQQAGLGSTPGYRALRSDLAPVEALTAVTARQGRTTKAAISIEVR